MILIDVRKTSTFDKKEKFFKKKKKKKGKIKNGGTPAARRAAGYTFERKIKRKSDLRRAIRVSCVYVCIYVYVHEHR